MSAMPLTEQRMPNVTPEGVNIARLTSLFRIWRELKPYTLWVVFTQAACLVSLGVGATIPFLLKHLGEAIQENRLDALLWVPWIAFGLSVIVAAAYFFRSVASQLVSLKVSHGLQKRIFERLVNQDLLESFKLPLGEKTSRMTFDIHWVVEGASLFLSESLYMPLLIVVCVSIMFYLDYRLAAITLALTPVTFLSGRFFSGKLRRSSKQLQELMALFSRGLLDSLRGLLLVKLYGREKREEAMLHDRLDAIFQLSARSVFWSSMLGAVIMIGNALVFSVVSGGAFLILTSNRTAHIPDLVGFAAVMLFFFGEVSRLGGAMNTLTRAAVSCERVFDFIGQVEAVNKEGGRAAGFEKEIVLQDIGYRYGDHMVLQHLNLTVRRGERIGIMGMSGAGKTTLMRLLVGLLEPQEGRITVDGMDLKEIETASLRNLFGYSPQLDAIFNMSVLDNIRYSCPEAGRDAVMQVSRLACADEFIRVLPHDYHTLVGEDGSHLSAGQRQRVAIARTLLRDAPIIILDESLSHVDLVTEKAIYKNIMSLKDKTILFVSHRPSVLAEADRVYSLSDGRLEEIEGLAGKIRESRHRELIRAMELVH